MRRVIVSLLVLVFPLQASAAQLTCRPVVKYIVEIDGAAQGDVGSIYTTVDLDKRRVSRCDARGCDNYRVNVAKSVAYTNVQTAIPNGYTLKLLKGEKTLYLEQATLGLGIVIYYGFCQ